MRGLAPAESLPQYSTLGPAGLRGDLDVDRATGDGQREGTLARHNGAVMRTHGREVDAQIAGDPSEPLVIAQPLGEGLSGAQEVEDTRLFAERHQGIAQVESQINSLFQRVAVLGEMFQGRQRLLKTRYGFAVRRTSGRPGSGLPAIGQGLVPHCTPEGMVRQAVHLFGQVVRGEVFEHLDNAGMQAPPSLLEQTAVGDLMRQGVLEGEFALREQPGLVEELSGLQVGQATLQHLLGQLGNGLEQGQGYLVANHRSGLEQTFFFQR